MANINGVTQVIGTNRGALDVYIQDQHTSMVNMFLHLDTVDTELSGSLPIGSSTITLYDSASALESVSGNIACSIVSDDNYFQTLVSGITGDVVELLMPTDKAFSDNDKVYLGQSNIAYINADISDQKTVTCHIPTNWDVDIYQLNFAMLNATDFDPGGFGSSEDPLTYGIIVREVNSSTNVMGVIINNISWALFGAESNYNLKDAGGALIIRKNFPISNGVSYRLLGSNDDRLELIIRDDITAYQPDLITCLASINGHKVE